MDKEIRMSKDGKGLMYVGTNCVDSDIIIPNTVEVIFYGAFKLCSKLENVIIPESVNYIGYKAFWDCKRLSNVVLPDSLRNISSCGFGRCGSLSKIKLPDFLEDTGENVFWYCSSLKKLTYKGVSYKIIVGDDGEPCVYEKSYKEKTSHNVIRNIKVYSGVKWFRKITNGKVVLDDCGFLVCDESRNLFYHAETKERAINGLFEKFENIRRGNAGKPTLTLQTLMTERDYISYTGACEGGVDSFKSQYKERFNKECPTEFILKDLLPLLKSIRSYDMPRLLASSDNEAVEFWNTLK